MKAPPLRLWLLLLAVVVDGTAVQGRPPLQPPAAAAPAVGTPAHDPLPTRVFLGQRYAEPPLGDRRLAPPSLRPFNASSLEPSGGPIAGAKGSECLQSSGGAEDCLFCPRPPGAFKRRSVP